MVSIGASLGYGILIVLAVVLGRSLDAGRERRLRQLVATERELLAEEREYIARERARLAEERDGYRQAVLRWRTVVREPGPARAEHQDDWEVLG
ncbi:MAG TPA: hypothetical protein VGH99_07290 [Pseudonocardia sp.]|jgi:hypothetical protein